MYIIFGSLFVALVVLYYAITLIPIVYGAAEALEGIARSNGDPVSEDSD